MSDLFDQPDDAATPLTADEKNGLKPAHIATRGQLNIAEQENVARGQEWASRRRQPVLSERFVTELHRHMFDDVWRWAGRFRSTERNIGIESWKIPAELRTLIDDTKAQIEAKAYSPDEIAIRFHHRLVFIHPFPNGNGRHARLMAELLIEELGGERFTWGRASLGDGSEVRGRYIAALKAADNHDIGPLLAFARSKGD